jgi:hypothetical protein
MVSSEKRSIISFIICQLLASCLLLCACTSGSSDETSTLWGYNSEEDTVTWEDEFYLHEQDVTGWSILTPSADSRLIYVSSTNGDDSTATYYLPSDSEIGDDPYDPSGNIDPYATIDAALDQVREDMPDYILLKQGDSWDNLDGTIYLTAGRSTIEKMVFTSYGDEQERPIIKNVGVNLSDASYSAIIGIHFYDAERDPSSSEFVGWDNVTASSDYVHSSESGFSALSGYGGEVTGSILIEGCWFEWYSGNAIQSAPDNDGVATLGDVVVRRNIISDNYSAVSHSQGFYTSHASVLLEENIFDHNGWYQQSNDYNNKEEGMATIFNHNTYFSGSNNTIFRKNLFLRASSIGTKFTSNPGDGTNEIEAWNILLDNNFYAEGELGISMGGNTDNDDGPRWDNIIIVNNVFTGIGRTQPTNRTLGWGIGVTDWDSGLVQDNLLIHWGDTELNNTYAISSGGHTTDVTYDGNIIYDVTSNGNLVSFSDGDIDGAQDSISFTNNEISLTADSSGQLLSYDMSAPEQNFSNNYYYFYADDDEWFKVFGEYTGFADYQSATEDTTSVQELRAYDYPDRSIESYLEAIGYRSDMDSFAEALKTQSKYNWLDELGADAINDYLREGFCTGDGTDCI